MSKGNTFIIVGKFMNTILLTEGAELLMEITEDGYLHSNFIIKTKR